MSCLISNTIVKMIRCFLHLQEHFPKNVLKKKKSSFYKMILGVTQYKGSEVKSLKSADFLYCKIPKNF